MHERISEYSTRQVSAIVGWSDRRVRYWARAGVVASRSSAGRYRYTFQDIVTLRTVRALTERVAPARARRVIRALARQLPAGRAASSVHVMTEGTRVVARDALSAWEPENGQALLDFDAARSGGHVSRLPVRNAAVIALEGAPGALVSTAAEWFRRGLEAETAGRVVDAQYAYANACRADPAHAPARINLGRLWHSQGKLREAHRLYREALAIAPDDATAWFNLGVVLEDGGDLRNAVSSYLRAIDRAPDLPDAHYNLARLYQQRGNLEAAVRHFSRYRSLTRRRDS